MSAPPKTVVSVSPEEAAAIRERVRNVDVKQLGAERELARPEHVPGLVALLSDPAVSDPIYDLPRPIDETNVARWVAEGEALRQRGEGLLIVNLDEDGVSGYSKVSIWPERASGELAGARRAALQNSGRASAGAAHMFGWMFEALGLRLICLTAALDNVRSARLIERAGFQPMGERDAVRPDGSVRRSLYWEMTRDAWEAQRASVEPPGPTEG